MNMRLRPRSRPRFPIATIGLPAITLILVSTLRAQPPAEIPITGRAVPELASFDTMMSDFVRNENLAGASIAVAREGKLVYARGFGYADRAKKEPVRPESLFRIASISKPITAVAIMRLIERGKLQLDNAVLNYLSHQPHLPHGGRVDPRWRDITLRHLMQHRGGWDRSQSLDAMFIPVEIAHSLGQKPPAGPNDVIRFMLGWRLDFEPGERYAYSNFGYCLLGRVIEKATGRTYQQHVQEDVLGPLGIRTMRIGRTLESGRAKGEVRYYTRGERTGIAVMGPKLMAKVPRPYGAWHLEAMDSHGAWIANASDLVRFGSAVQRSDRSKLLSEQSVRRMFARPLGAAGHDENGRPKDQHYGCGWFVRHIGEGRYNYWHTGSLAGTSTILVLRHDGLCWSVLFNMRETLDGSRPSLGVDPLVHKAADSVKRWPDHDLFRSKRN